MLTNGEWLFFDVGSTLVDESLVTENRLRSVAEQAGISFEQVAEMALQFYRQNRKGDLEVIRRLNVKKPAWTFEDERLYPDTADCLKRLHARYRIGVIANQALGTADRLREFGILQEFDLVVASAEEGVEKPDPRIFQIALERAGCRPEEAFMIGDRIDNDIMPAKRLGMRTVWIQQGYGKYWQISGDAEAPDITADSLTELADILLQSGMK